MEIRKHLHVLNKVIISISSLKYTVADKKCIYHYLSFFCGYTIWHFQEHSVLLLVKNNGANVISNDIKPTKIQNIHLNKPDAAFKTILTYFWIAHLANPYLSGHRCRPNIQIIGKYVYTSLYALMACIK